MIAKHAAGWPFGRIMLAAVVCGLGVAATVQYPALAAIDTACDTAPATQFFTLKPWNACFADGEITIQSLPELWYIAYPVLEDMIKVAGYLAAGLNIWGGIKYIKSQGNPQELTAARAVIVNSSIGLAIAVLSVLIVQFVTQSFKEV